jgi:hypothetical protein
MAPQNITLSDIESLVSRLTARAKSRIGTDTPSSKSDILLAAKLLQRWCRRDVDQLRTPFDLSDDD